MNRREFIQFSALTSVASAGLLPSLAFSEENLQSRKILLLVELEGGNDGLNTLVPYTNSVYRNQKVRRSLALSKSNIIDVGSNMGMHESLRPLHNYWQQEELAWIQNVGFEKNDGSHFRSRDIWENAGSFDQLPDQGWLSQILPQKSFGLDGIVVGDGLGPMRGKGCRSVALRDPTSFIRQAESLDLLDKDCSNPSLQHIVDVQRQLHGAKDLLKRSARMHNINQFFPVRRTFNNDLKSVAKMIVGGANASIYKVTLSGFDTHAAQAVTHKNLLHYLAEGLNSFATAMKANDMWDSVLVMTYSEFGRRIRENLSAGTDHGEAAPMLVMGGKVKGGVLYGDNPDLKNHDEWNVKHQIDFRSVYGSVTKNWLDLDNPWEKLSTVDFV